MKTLAQLQDERGQLVTQARSALDDIKSNTDEARSIELNERHDKIMTEFDAIDKTIEREQKIADIEARVAAAAEADARAKRPNGNGSADAGDNGEQITYRSAFAEYLSCEGQVGAMSPEARAVLSAGFQKVEQRAQTTAVAAGGYTIPEEMMPNLVRSMLAWGPMYDPGVTTEMVTSGGNSMPFPTVNDTANATNVAHTEGTALTDDGGADVTLGEKQLDAFAYNTEWLRVSKELADDSAFAMEVLLASLLGERLGRTANLQLTTGSGSGAPNGIVTASSLGNTAAAVAAVTYDEIIDLEHSVDPAYRDSPSVRFMFNDSTLKAVRKLKDGQGNYLWQAGNVQAGIPGQLNGRPYSINQAMASLATGNKVMLFGDFSKYFVRKVGAPLIGAIQDKDFWPGFGVAGYIRFDGELGDTAAVKHLITA